MRLMLAAVGRARQEPETVLFEQYWKRAAALGPKLGFTAFSIAIVENSRRGTAAARKREEAEWLRRHLPSDAYPILLDERGRSLSSDDFAKLLATLRDRNIGDAVFVIGGPDGLLPDFRDSAERRIAFGMQTWPHLLVRAMLAEQIYRALTILSGHPYHRV
jgi:23S rRNA (pseudouridine1915-N3)-methyltransferase